MGKNYSSEPIGPPNSYLSADQHDQFPIGTHLQVVDIHLFMKVIFFQLQRFELIKPDFELCIDYHEVFVRYKLYKVVLLAVTLVNIDRRLFLELFKIVYLQPIDPFRTI